MFGLLLFNAAFHGVLNAIIVAQCVATLLTRQRPWFESRKASIHTAPAAAPHDTHRTRTSHPVDFRYRTLHYGNRENHCKMTISRLALASRGLALSSVALSSAITWRSEDLIDLTVQAGLSIAAMTTVMVVVLAWSSRHHGE